MDSGESGSASLAGGNRNITDSTIARQLSRRSVVLTVSFMGSDGESFGVAFNVNELQRRMLLAVTLLHHCVIVEIVVYRDDSARLTSIHNPPKARKTFVMAMLVRKYFQNTRPQRISMKLSLGAGVNYIAQLVTRRRQTSRFMVTRNI